MYLILFLGCVLFCSSCVAFITWFSIHFYRVGHVSLYYDEGQLVFRTARTVDSAFLLAYMSFPTERRQKLSFQIDGHLLPISDGILDSVLETELIENGYATEWFPESKMSHRIPESYLLSQGCTLKKFTVTGRNAVIVFIVSKEQKILKLYAWAPQEEGDYYKPEIKLVCDGISYPLPLEKQEVITIFGTPQKEKWGAPLL